MFSTGIPIPSVIWLNRLCGVLLAIIAKSTSLASSRFSAFRKYGLKRVPGIIVSRSASETDGFINIQGLDCHLRNRRLAVLFLPPLATMAHLADCLVVFQSRYPGYSTNNPYFLILFHLSFVSPSAWHQQRDSAVSDCMRLLCVLLIYLFCLDLAILERSCVRAGQSEPNIDFLEQAYPVD